VKDKMTGFAQVAGVFLAAIATFSAFWYGMFWIAQAAGFNLQSTPEYGFSSGIGPMILAALGYSTLCTGLWHGLNCHHPGCPRIGRHKIDGTPYCNVHHEDYRPEIKVEDLLRQILDELKPSRRSRTKS
jgi:hypothetical protein